MNTQLLDKVEKTYYKKNLPPFETGDTISIKAIIREGEKKRFQTFKGIVIAIKGSGLSKSFTVRKISFGIGVEKIFPFHSPNIESIELLKKGNVRRSKLYYLRGRIGKSATKVRAGVMSDKLMKELEELKKIGVVTESTEPQEEVTQVNEPESSETQKEEEKPQDK